MTVISQDICLTNQFNHQALTNSACEVSLNQSGCISLTAATVQAILRQTAKAFIWICKEATANTFLYWDMAMLHMI